MIRRIAAIGATVLAALVGLMPAADGRPTAPTFPPQRPTRVLVLGDSVMKGAATTIAPTLPGREVIVDAEVNRSTGQGAEVIDRLGTDWDVVVVLLGHNDGGTPGAYQPAVRRILDQLRGVRSVSWLTIHEVRPYYPDVNRFVAEQVATHPNLRTGDWNAVAAANPGAVAADGLHLNGTGAQLMADLVAEQVQIAELEYLAALQRLARAATTTTTTSTTTTTAPPTTTSTSTTTTTTTTTEATTTSRPRPATTTSGASDEPEAAGGDDDDGSGSGAVAGAAVAVLALGGGAVALARRRRAST